MTQYIKLVKGNSSSIDGLTPSQLQTYLDAGYKIVQISHPILSSHGNGGWLVVLEKEENKK